MELRDYCDNDLWLAEALECDPEVMKDLGGPTKKADVQRHHKRRLNHVLNKEIWYYTIIPEPRNGAVGTIGIWESDWKGSKIHEMGWMILPAFQGRGLATAAGRMILERAKHDRRFKEIHAFPSIRNAASNAICRKLGFSLLGEVNLAYNGPPQACNDWKIDLHT